MVFGWAGELNKVIHTTRPQTHKCLTHLNDSGSLSVLLGHGKTRCIYFENPPGAAIAHELCFVHGPFVGPTSRSQQKISTQNWERKFHTCIVIPNFHLQTHQTKSDNGSLSIFCFPISKLQCLVFSFQNENPLAAKYMDRKGVLWICTRLLFLSDQMCVSVNWDWIV